VAIRVDHPIARDIGEQTYGRRSFRCHGGDRSADFAICVDQDAALTLVIGQLQESALRRRFQQRCGFLSVGVHDDQCRTVIDRACEHECLAKTIANAQ
jgi:hypothetical protein